MELDLRDACEGRVLATPVEDTIRGSRRARRALWSSLRVRWRCASPVGGPFVGRCWRLRGARLCNRGCTRIVFAHPRVGARLASKPHYQPTSSLLLFCAYMVLGAHGGRQRRSEAHPSRRRVSMARRRNAAVASKTAAIDPARSPVTKVDTAGAHRARQHRRDPSCSKSRLRASQYGKPKKEKISPVRLYTASSVSSRSTPAQHRTSRRGARSSSRMQPFSKRLKSCASLLVRAPTFTEEAGWPSTRNRAKSVL